MRSLTQSPGSLFVQAALFACSALAPLSACSTTAPSTGQPTAMATTLPAFGILPVEVTPSPSMPSAAAPSPLAMPSGYPVLPPTPPATGGYPAPTQAFTPRPRSTSTPVVAPTVALAPNAISPENAAALRASTRVAPPSFEQVNQFWTQFLGLGPVLDAAFSSDGSLVAVAKVYGIYVYDLRELKPLRFIDTGDVVPERVFFLPDDKTLIASSDLEDLMRGATFFDIDSGQRMSMIRVPQPVKEPMSTLAQPSPDGQTLMIQTGNWGTLYDRLSRRPATFWPRDGFFLGSFAFSPDSQLLATAFGHVTVWEVATRRVLFNATEPNSSGTLAPLVAFSPDGRLFGTTDDRRLVVWDVARRKKLFEAQLVKLLGVNSDSLAFSPDGTALVISQGNQQLSMWDTATGQKRVELSGKSPQFAPDGRLLINTALNTYAFIDAKTGQTESHITAHHLRVAPDGRLVDVEDDGSIRILDNSGQTTAALALPALPSAMTSLAFLPDDRLVMGFANSTVRLQEPPQTWNGREFFAQEQGAWVYQVAVAPDGKAFASASKDGTLARFNADNYPYSMPWLGQDQFGGPPGELSSLAFSSDGLMIAAGSSDGAVKLWNTASPLVTPTQVLKGHTDWVWGVAFSPDGRQLASASADQTLRVWDLATGTTLRTLSGHQGAVHSVAYSPDGSLLASGAWDGTAKVWDAASGDLLRTFSSPGAEVNQVAFSRDGRVIAAALDNGTVRLWETATGHELVALKPGGGSVSGVAFSADGRQLAAALSDGTAQIWEAP